MNEKISNLSTNLLLPTEKQKHKQRMRTNYKIVRHLLKLVLHLMTRFETELN